jgi:hypothetical protein
MSEDSPFMQAFRGRFQGVRRWEQLDELWSCLRGQKSWYIYAVGEEPPREPSSVQQMDTFIKEIDRLLRAEHEEEYCGIVYVDNLPAPAFVKIYDPNNLGMVCGSSEIPPLPGWILSRTAPVDLPSAITPPARRRHWWQRLMG